MGGFVGMRVAARRPELVRSLVLMETASDGEPWRSAPRYAAMSFLTRFFGTGPFVPAVMKIMFARPFREDPARAEALRSQAPTRVEQEVWGLLLAYNLLRLVMSRAAPRLSTMICASVAVVRSSPFFAPTTAGPGWRPEG